MQTWPKSSAKNKAGKSTRGDSGSLKQLSFNTAWAATDFLFIPTNDDWWHTFDSAVWCAVSGGSLEDLGSAMGEQVGGKWRTHLSLVSAEMQKKKKR